MTKASNLAIRAQNLINKVQFMKVCDSVKIKKGFKIQIEFFVHIVD